MRIYFFLILIFFLANCCDQHFDGSKVFKLDNSNFDEMTKVDGLTNFWVVLFHNGSSSESFEIFEKMRPLAENPVKQMEFGIVDW